MSNGFLAYYRLMWFQDLSCIAEWLPLGLRSCGMVAL
jgi:hypothetical protein